MHTLAGWFESQDTSGNLTPVAALADQHLTIDGDGIVVPDALNQIVGGFASADTAITRAQFQSPSIRRYIDAEINPLAAAVEPGDPVEFYDLRRSPIVLDPDENLEFHAAEGAAGAEAAYGLVWLADGPIQPVDAANVRTIRATAGATLTADAWTNTGALTFAETLPAGRYRIIGMCAIAAGLIAARLVVPGASWRPGVLGQDSELGHAGHASVFRMGRFGVFAEFDHNRLPTVDCLSLSADTSETFLFDIVPV